MILSKEVEINVTPASFKRLTNLGYTELHTNCKITIPIEHLQKGSNVKILVKCDICGKEKYLRYYKYIKNISNLNIYCCSTKCSQIKVKTTSLKKFGQTSFRKTDEYAKKYKITCLKLYGVENVFQNDDVKNKIKKTNLERYGTENIGQSELKKEKIRKTNLIKYGAEYSAQNEEVFNKTQKAAFKLKFHKSTKLYYWGTYEKDFLDFCFINKIPIKKGKTIKYFFEGKFRVYFSDFYLEKNNLIVEVKSSYTYKKDLNKNLAKQKACLDQGYCFIFVINKKYDEFLNFLNQKVSSEFKI